VFVIADLDPPDKPAVEQPGGGWAMVPHDDGLDWATELDRPEGAGSVRTLG
jgi:hypothetical protein